MTRLDEIREYTAGVKRARDAYRDDSLRAEARCIACTGPWRGAGRMCVQCRNRQARAAR